MALKTARHFIPLALGSLLAPLLLPACDSVEATDRFVLDPDTPVVIVVIDTLRADRLSCYGYPLDTSPVLDELASRSYLFEANSSQCNATFPSLTSIFTGTYPKTHRSYLAVPVEGTAGGGQQLVCLPERFKEQGYSTLATISHPAYSANSDTDAVLWHGWDSISFIGEPIPATERPLWARADYTNERLFGQLDALQGGGPAKPLFLWAHYFDPHTDLRGNLYKPPDHLRNRWFSHHFEENGLEEFVELLEPLGPAERHEWIIEDAPTGPIRSVLKLAHGRASYDAEVRASDEGVGELFARLEEDGILERALIVVMADHGENMELHTEERDAHPFTHGRLYDGVTHVPLLIHLPGQTQGERISAMTQSIDVVPTILELLDLAPTGSLDGVSLVPLLRDKGNVLHEYVYMESSSTSEKAVRSDMLKLMDGGNKERELYGWRTDRGENYNLEHELEGEMVKPLIEALDHFRPKVSLRIHFEAMAEPYEAEIDFELPGGAIGRIVGADPGCLSETGDAFHWSGTVGPEGHDILLFPKGHDRNTVTLWRVRHSGREDLAQAVWLSKTPVSATPAIPLWTPIEGEAPTDPLAVISALPHRNTVSVEVFPHGARRTECELRFLQPTYEKTLTVLDIEGVTFEERGAKRPYGFEGIDVERAWATLERSHPADTLCWLLRFDGQWPDARRLVVNGSPVDRSELRFAFPALPFDRRIGPYLKSGMPTTPLPPGTVVIWQETGGAGGEIDASSLSPELVEQLKAIGYVGDE